jgi:hypothetical protein
MSQTLRDHSISNSQGLFVGHTRHETRLLALVNSPAFQTAVNGRLATPLMIEDFMRLFESYASTQFMTDTPPDNVLERRFRDFCVQNGPRMTVPRPVQPRRTKHPSGQSFMSYPEVEKSAGGREMERPLR